MFRKRSIFYFFLLSFIFKAILIFPDDLADRLLKEMDRALFPSSFIAKMRMTNHKPVKEDQSFDMIVYNKENVGALMIFTSPPSEKGKKMLLVANTIWFYVPGTSRAVSLSSRQPFMGSTFSNSDLMDSTMHDDYEPEVIAEEKIDVTDCYCLELKAKNKGVTYKKIIIWIRKDYRVPVKIEYYTLSGKLFKTMKLFNLKKIAGIIRPANYIMENVLQKETFTEVEILGITEKKDLKNSIFTQGYLTK